MGAMCGPSFGTPRRLRDRPARVRSDSGGSDGRSAFRLETFQFGTRNGVRTRRVEFTRAARKPVRADRLREEEATRVAPPLDPRSGVSMLEQPRTSVRRAFPVDGERWRPWAVSPERASGGRRASVSSGEPPLGGRDEEDCADEGACRPMKDGRLDEERVDVEYDRVDVGGSRERRRLRARSELKAWSFAAAVRGPPRRPGQSRLDRPPKTNSLTTDGARRRQFVRPSPLPDQTNQPRPARRSAS